MSSLRRGLPGRTKGRRKLCMRPCHSFYIIYGTWRSEEVEGGRGSSTVIICGGQATEEGEIVMEGADPSRHHKLLLKTAFLRILQFHAHNFIHALFMRYYTLKNLGIWLVMSILAHNSRTRILANIRFALKYQYQQQYVFFFFHFRLIPKKLNFKILSKIIGTPFLAHFA